NSINNAIVSKLDISTTINNKINNNTDNSLSSKISHKNEVISNTSLMNVRYTCDSNNLNNDIENTSSDTINFILSDNTNDKKKSFGKLLFDNYKIERAKKKQKLSSNKVD